MRAEHPVVLQRLCRGRGAGFASFALGSQTGGSIIRPASFCGIVGFKPSFGLLPTDGVQAISTTLDHLGVFAATPRDAWYFVTAMLEQQAEIIKPQQPERVCVLRLPDWLSVEKELREHMAAVAEQLRRTGVAAEEVDLPFPKEDFLHLQETICYWEASRILLTPGGTQLSRELVDLLQPYLAVDLNVYAAARIRRQEHQARFHAFAAGYEAVLMPAAPGIAPTGHAHTGDAMMNRFWTALHVPAIAVPRWRSVEGMPLGLQVVGRLGADRSLARVAQWFHEWRGDVS